MSNTGIFAGLRSLLGTLNGDQTAQKAAWRRFAEAVGGEYREEEGVGLFDFLEASVPGGPRLLAGSSSSDTHQKVTVAAPVGGWNILLDSYVIRSVGRDSDSVSRTTFTRMAVPYVPGRSFSFALYPRNLFTRAALALPYGPKQPEVTLSDSALGKAFLLTSDDAATARDLLAHPDVQRLLLLLKLSKAQLTAGVPGQRAQRLPDGIAQLCYEHQNPYITLNDVQQLQRLHGLVALLAQELQRLGLAAAPA